jgi:hypothetical protein
MGINFATEMVKQNKSNEVRMWRAVINNAIGDVTADLSDRKSSLLKMEVHSWIMDNTKDFQLVCYYAELEPDDVRRQYIRAVQDKKIIFTDRQLKWKKYNDNYQKLKDIPNKEDRRELRKIVDYLRRLVMNATNQPIDI